MIRVLPIFVGCMTLSGCIVPQIHKEDLIPNLTGHRIETLAVDSTTQAAVSEAKAVVILHRRQAYLPDAAIGAEKCPRIVSENYEQVGKLTTTDRELYVWPFFATGTVHGGANILVHREGYLPAEFPLNRPSRYGYPKTLPLVPCDPTQGRQALVEWVLEHIPREEWKDYARKVLASM